MERQKKQLTEEQAYTRLAHLCSTTEYCRHDLRRKMQAYLLPEGAEERILTRLQKERFVDEARFAHAFVRDKFRFSRWGRQRIAMELHARGIDSQAIDDALTEIDEEDSEQTLEQLLRAKLKSTHARNDYELFLKLLRYSVGRGFPQEQAHRCLQRIIHTEEAL